MIYRLLIYNSTYGQATIVGRRKKEVKEAFEQLEQEQDLTNLDILFLNSLCDASSIFECSLNLYPENLIEANRDKLAQFFYEVTQNPNFHNRDFFKEFEDMYVSQDVLCKHIIAKKLSSLNIPVKRLKANAHFDLEIEQKNIKIEIKRITSWSNYSEYLYKFIKKSKKADKKYRFLYIVATTHPFAIDEIIKGITDKDGLALNKYIRNIINSHYVAECLIKDLEYEKDIQFVIQYIDKDGENNYSLSSLCNSIIDKIYANDKSNA